MRIYFVDQFICYFEGKPACVYCILYCSFSGKLIKIGVTLWTLELTLQSIIINNIATGEYLLLSDTSYCTIIEVSVRTYFYTYNMCIVLG